MTMFDDIATAIGQALGADKTTGGYVAGALFTVVLIFVLEWSLGRERESSMLLISVGLGVVLSGLFGWFPLWIPFMMGLIIALILFNTMDRFRGE